jgi:hypothetical protein
MILEEPSTWLFLFFKESMYVSVAYASCINSNYIGHYRIFIVVNFFTL